MINILNSKTAQIPSPSGMPIFGHACATGLATPVVRDLVGVKGADLGRTQGYFPGTSAWRPPSC